MTTLVGILKIFAIGPGTLTRGRPGRQLPLGARRDLERRWPPVLQQCAAERAIQVFHFDGQSLPRDEAATMRFESRPGAIATHRSR